ncbi:hypothetical protein [Haloferax profundi]|uniref:XPG-I domain-containing protein n=1 Tax=Haloferax profundi TaxID=1544718 RepID=A0A0W1SEY1_9EURY|nr:hypothetical protein [Haloferax profundi]KTG24744.1 hypothetical protein AUR66_16565 [Haloferax profundi]
MGCEDLRQITGRQETKLSEFRGGVLAIDATFWLQRYYHAVVTKQIPKDDRVVEGECDISQAFSLLVSLPDIFRHDITPVFFFDPMRRSRRRSKSDTTISYLQHAPNPSEPQKHFPFLQRATEVMLWHLDIPFSVAPLYAEADASVYVRGGYADAVVSNDYDTLLFGAPTTLRKPFGSPWETVEFESTLNRNDLTYRELLDVAILTGTDEIRGPYNRHIDEAMSLVKSAEDLDEFEQEYNEYLRAPSLNVNDPYPTFEELRMLYEYPVTNPHCNWPKPSGPSPDIPSLVKFLYKLGVRPELFSVLLDDIQDEI